MVLVIFLLVWNVDSKLAFKTTNYNLRLLILIIVNIGYTYVVVVKLFILAYCSTPPLLYLK
jgi:hypothetical protein